MTTDKISHIGTLLGQNEVYTSITRFAKQQRKFGT